VEVRWIEVPQVVKVATVEHAWEPPWAREPRTERVMRKDIVVVKTVVMLRASNCQCLLYNDTIRDENGMSRTL
jgi:hypothetical protein